MPRWDYVCDRCAMTEERSYPTAKDAPLTDRCPEPFCGGVLVKRPARGSFVIKG